MVTERIDQSSKRRALEDLGFKQIEQGHFLKESLNRLLSGEDLLVYCDKRAEYTLKANKLKQKLSKLQGYLDLGEEFSDFSSDDNSVAQASVPKF